MEITENNKNWVDVPAGLLNRDYMSNPYPTYEKLRSLGRVVRIVDGEKKVWVFSHYDDVAAIQKDKRFSSRRSPELLRLAPREYHEEFKYFSDFLDMIVASHDGEDHKRLRKIINQGFTTYELNKLKSDIQTSADVLIDKIASHGRMEFVKEFAHPLPAIVIMKILGVTLDEREQWMSWSDEILAFIGMMRNFDVPAARRAQHTLKLMMDSFVALITLRRARPENDLISHLLLAQSDDGEQLMNDNELAAQCCLLIINGNETTRNLLSSTLMLLFTHKEQKKQLDSNPELLDAVIEEVLRFESPVQFLRRIASENFEYLGVPIRDGDSIFLMLGSSHRDPLHYQNPESFNIARHEKKHMAFGSGVHYCVGAALSRLEAQIALSTLFKRLPNLDLVNDNTEWEWNMNPVFRGLERLEVKF
jgi:cytochrome P450